MLLHHLFSPNTHRDTSVQAGWESASPHVHVQLQKFGRIKVNNDFYDVNDIWQRVYNIPSRCAGITQARL